jgi:hypothetical protein
MVEEFAVNPEQERFSVKQIIPVILGSGGWDGDIRI